MKQNDEVPELSISSTSEEEYEEEEEEDDEEYEESSFAMRFSQEVAEQAEWMAQCHNPLGYLSSLIDQDQQHQVPKEPLLSPKFQIQKEEQQQQLPEINRYKYQPCPLPKHCEYCESRNSNLTTVCSTPGCQRPSSFFPKQRPPFSPPGSQWDPESDHTTITIDNHQYRHRHRKARNQQETTSLPHKAKKSEAWLTRLFGSGSFDQR